MRTDVLIIGTGIAGLFAALKISEFADVIIATKKNKSESNTNYAQGGIASVMDAHDSFTRHIEDTIEAGAGLCNKKIVSLTVREGPGRINDLIDIGARFTKKHGKFDLAREGGHSMPRILHAKDLTGAEIERALINAVNEKDNIRVLEHCVAIDLITEHNVLQLKNKTLSNRNCWGAYILDSESNKVFRVISKVTLIATGGLGQIYLHTTNPFIATGDGYAMAYRAGAKLANMEFIQFHPTSLYNKAPDGTKDQPSFLISEAVRGFGAKLRLKTGETFMERYDSRKELAPRDIVARAIDNELKKSGTEYVYLDVTHKKRTSIMDHFPNIYSKCIDSGIDITKDYIPVVPAAHYACGGIAVDEYSRTSLTGLYACGEVSMTGLHGANRLASNSLLEAVVFAFRASKDIKEFIIHYNRIIPDVPDWDDSGTLSADEKILITHSFREAKEIMWNYVGIVRSDLRLEMARKRIHTLFEETESLYKKTKVFEEVLELRNVIACSHIIIKSASLRKESRGLHFTLNYPKPDNTRKTVNTYIRNRHI